ncbi:AraC family transcriptional regulator [Pelagibacterium montanilacus]|uniref:AraC family transcriptional regulator n=1 Tax=Pelagibacterium montanilacus TaxID=2185280 RepID=UPI0019CF82F7|nr:AraC family transcriptional regulator [Pelagibacterium montanilacus]
MDHERITAEAGDRTAGSLLHTVLTGYADAHGGGEGFFPTEIKAMRILRTYRPIMPAHTVYAPQLCIVVQGAKRIEFGGDSLDYTAMQCLVVSVELPATGRITKASVEEPFISVTIDFDVATLREVMTMVDVKPAQAGDPGPRPFIADVDGPLADCVVRLIRMLDTPKAIPVLFPSVMREICFWLLSGPHGAVISQLALPETQTGGVVNAIQLLRRNYTQTMRVERLAEEARMSPSSFHQHFKSLTSMSPLQYQKHLRLIEARRLLIGGDVKVAEAAYRVGYESASQFSREFSRTFGMSPSQVVSSLTPEARQQIEAASALMRAR